MLSVIYNDEKERWNDIVRSFENYDVYYLAEYSESFQIHGDGDPLLFYYQDDNIRAMNVVMKRDIAEFNSFRDKLPSKTYFDIATPYGYGGILFEGNATEASLDRLKEQYSSFCIGNSIVSEFVRINPLNNGHEFYSDNYVCKCLGNTVKIDLGPPEYIWENMKKDCRRWIRVAKDHGVHVVKDEELSTIETFRIIYKQTMDRKNADPYYYFNGDFCKNFLKLKENAAIYSAVYEGKIISSVLVIYGAKNANAHLSCSLNEYMDFGSKDLVFYEAACDLYRKGFEKLHLGGGYGTQDDTLLKFKKKFNRKGLIDYYVARRVYFPELYDELVSMRKAEIIRTHLDADNMVNVDAVNDYFPKYRAEFAVVN